MGDAVLPNLRYDRVLHQLPDVGAECLPSRSYTRSGPGEYRKQGIGRGRGLRRHGARRASSVAGARSTTWRSSESATSCPISCTRSGDDFGISRERRFDDYRQMLQQVKPDGVYVIGPAPPHVRHLDLVPGAEAEPLHREAAGAHDPPGAVAGIPGAGETAASPRSATSAGRPPLLRPPAGGVPGAGADRARGGGVLQVRDQSGARFPRDHMMDDCTHSVG